MKDFMGYELALGDLVGVVTFAPAGERLGWKLALGQIKQFPTADEVGELCMIYVLSGTAPGWVEGRSDRIQFYSTAYRDTEVSLLLEMFGGKRVPNA